MYTVYLLQINGKCFLTFITVDEWTCVCVCQYTIDKQVFSCSNFELQHTLMFVQEYVL